jgi:hypothetical protein
MNNPKTRRPENDAYPLPTRRAFLAEAKVAALAPTSAMICWAESTPSPGTFVCFRQACVVEENGLFLRGFAAAASG